MKNEINSNKHGQALGTKGHATRKRLLDAAERLLAIKSPVELTAVAIAKEAKTSSATFYMYFDDVQDILFALSLVAGAEVVSAIQKLDSSSRAGSAEERATELVTVFNKVWSKHRHVLRYRNMESDRRDDTFDKLRIEAYERELGILVKWIQGEEGAETGVSYGDCYALASVLHASLERLASVDPVIVRKGVGMKRLVAAQARIIAQVITDSPSWGRLPIGKA
jgi:AcrR family transcriptional regulator